MGDWDINGYVNVENKLKSILKSSSSVSKVIDDEKFVTWSMVFFFVLYIVCNIMVIVFVVRYLCSLKLMSWLQ